MDLGEVSGGCLEFGQADSLLLEFSIAEEILCTKKLS